jgi:hypothetical protein
LLSNISYFKKQVYRHISSIFCEYYKYEWGISAMNSRTLLLTSIKLLYHNFFIYVIQVRTEDFKVYEISSWPVCYTTIPINVFGEALYNTWIPWAPNPLTANPPTPNNIVRRWQTVLESFGAVGNRRVRKRRILQRRILQLRTIRWVYIIILNTVPTCL